MDLGNKSGDKPGGNKNKLIMTFLKTVGVILGVFFVAAGILTAALIKTGTLNNIEDVIPGLPQLLTITGNDQTPTSLGNNSGGGLFSNMFKPPRMTNVLFMFMDQDNVNTDALMLASFNSDTKQVSVISIPRDTYTMISDDEYQEMRANKSPYPTHGPIKINGVYPYGGKTFGIKLLEAKVSQLLNTDINYYAIIKISAFRKIVDAIGGVDMQLRPEGFDYDDPTQNLHIHIPGGWQHLDGKTAEGVVRYRHDYLMGDLGRIPVQQEFMKQFLKQLLNKQTILNNLPTFISTIYSDIQTDFSITDILKYVKYVNDVSTDNFSFFELPGSPDDSSSGYFIPDTAQIRALSDKLFYSDDPSVTPGGSPRASAGSGLYSSKAPANSKGVRVTVLNGTDYRGLAQDFAQKLADDGYTIIDIGNSNGSQKKATDIYVCRQAVGDQLEPYFKSVKIHIDPNLFDNEAKIIIGTGDAPDS